jgi:hypothetical protein
VPSPQRTRFALRGIQPNPFNPRTTIHFSTPHRANVRLQIFDSHGRLVRTILDSSLEPGLHAVPWDGTTDAGARVASGVHRCVLSFPGASQTGTLALNK